MGDDIPRPVSRTTWHILRQRHRRRHRDRQLQPCRSHYRRYHRSRPTHIRNHVLHVGRRLHRNPARIKRDSLADKRHMLLRVRRPIPQLHQPRLPRRPRPHGQNPPKPLLLQLRLIPALKVQIIVLGNNAQRRSICFGIQMRRRRIHQIPSKIHRLGHHQRPLACRLILLPAKHLDALHRSIRRWHIMLEPKILIRPQQCPRHRGGRIKRLKIHHECRIHPGERPGHQAASPTHRFRSAIVETPQPHRNREIRIIPLRNRYPHHLAIPTSSSHSQKHRPQPIRMRHPLRPFLIVIREKRHHQRLVVL